MEKHFNWTDKYTFRMDFSGTYSNQLTFGTIRSSLLNQPSYNPLDDSKTHILNQFRGRKFAALVIKNMFHLAHSLQIRIEAYSMLNTEKLVGKEGFVGAYIQNHSLRFSGTTGVLYQSIIGPISLRLNYYDSTNSNWAELLLIRYMSFNKKSLN